MKLLLICIISLSIVKSLAKPVYYKCDSKCAQYLLKYGYITVEPNSYTSHETAITQGIKNIQKDAGLPETGFMDQKTFNLFNTPRCGVGYHGSREKRFAILRGWRTKKTILNETMVTWYADLSNFKDMDKNTALSIFTTAMNMWSETALLKLIQVFNEDEANITIKFLSKNHGDNYNFDGKGGVLGHAFFPNGASGISGDVHFDSDERWNIYGNGKDNVSLFVVALHEFGHSLGLSHSSLEDSIMYAWYKVKQFKLFDDDKLGINALYGTRKQYLYAPLDPKYRVVRPNNSPTTDSPTFGGWTTESPTTTGTTFFPSTTTRTSTFNPSSTRSPSYTTTRKYNFRRIFIQNSNVLIYPKEPAKLTF
jgi:matrix metalloproteinase-16 (membrane-inserted)